MGAFAFLPDLIHSFVGEGLSLEGSPASGLLSRYGKPDADAASPRGARPWTRASQARAKGKRLLNKDLGLSMK